MVSTTSKHILVTIGGFFVTVAAQVGVLVAYVALDLHEPVMLDSFAPWLAPPALLLGLLFGILGATVAGAVSVLRSPKPPSKPPATPPASTTPASTPSSDSPTRLPESLHSLVAADTSPFVLPTHGPYVMLTMDEARMVERTVNDLRGEVASLEDRLAVAYLRLGEQTATSPSQLPQIQPSTMTPEPEPPERRSNAGWPLVICEKCGREFEQTIKGRTKCPDCWSLEEYMQKPIRQAAPPPPVSAPQPQPVDPVQVAVARLSKSLPLLRVLRHFADHSGQKVVDVAKELQLTRGTASDRVNDLVRLGLMVKENGGFKLTELGEKAKEATQGVDAGTVAVAAPTPAPAPAPWT